MSTKTEYQVNDTAWIHLNGEKLFEGRVIKKFTLEEAGYSPDLIFYVVEVATLVDPILEIRNWFTMSEDKLGPIGVWRDKRT